MDSIKTAIDRAAEMCGGQVKLADKIGVAQPTISAARNLKRKLPTHALLAMSDVLEVDFRSLHELQERAHGKRFKAAAEVAAGAFLSVVLSVAPNDAKAIAIGAKASNAVTGVHAHCRQLTLWVLHLWGRLGSRLTACRPMCWAC